MFNIFIIDEIIEVIYTVRRAVSLLWLSYTCYTRNQCKWLMSFCFVAGTLPLNSNGVARGWPG